MHQNHWSSLSLTSSNLPVLIVTHNCVSERITRHSFSEKRGMFICNRVNLESRLQTKTLCFVLTFILIPQTLHDTVIVEAAPEQPEQPERR